MDDTANCTSHITSDLMELMPTRSNSVVQISTDDLTRRCSHTTGGSIETGGGSPRSHRNKAGDALRPHPPSTPASTRVNPHRTSSRIHMELLAIDTLDTPLLSAASAAVGHLAIDSGTERGSSSTGTQPVLGLPQPLSPTSSMGSRYYGSSVNSSSYETVSTQPSGWGYSSPGPGPKRVTASLKSPSFDKDDLNNFGDNSSLSSTLLPGRRVTTSQLYHLEPTENNIHRVPISLSGKEVPVLTATASSRPSVRPGGDIDHLAQTRTPTTTTNTTIIGQPTVPPSLSSEYTELSTSGDREQSASDGFLSNHAPPSNRYLETKVGAQPPGSPISAIFPDQRGSLVSGTGRPFYPELSPGAVNTPAWGTLQLGAITGGMTPSNMGSNLISLQEASFTVSESVASTFESLRRGTGFTSDGIPSPTRCVSASHNIGDSSPESKQARRTNTLRKYKDKHGNRYINGYRIIRELGRGSCGVVNLASDEKSNLVAIKYVRRAETKRRLGGPTAAQQNFNAFMREVAIMTKLRHKNIVSVYEVIDDPDADKLYLIMQYVDRGTIAHIEVKCGTDKVCDPIPPGELIQYAQQMLAGLEYLHSHNVVHRDIKPDNILVDGSQQVYLADFGVAETFDTQYRERMERRMLESMAQSMAMSVAGGRAAGPLVLGPNGTMLFIAPELWAGGRSAGKPVDMWAMGVTLYTLLTGTLPFSNLDEIRDQRLPVIPTAYGEEWVTLLQGLLNRDPHARLTATQARQMVQKICVINEKRAIVEERTKSLLSKQRKQAAASSSPPAMGSRGSGVALPSVQQQRSVGVSSSGSSTANSPMPPPIGQSAQQRGRRFCPNPMVTRMAPLDNVAISEAGDNNYSNSSSGFGVANRVALPPEGSPRATRHQSAVVLTATASSNSNTNSNKAVLSNETVVQPLSPAMGSSLPFVSVPRASTATPKASRAQQVGRPPSAISNKGRL